MIKNYVDIHTHILPGIDDGARTMDESIRMLEMAYEEGVRTMYATPHYGMPDFEINQMDCELMVDALNAEIRMHGGMTNMKVLLGNEILYHSGVADEIKSGAVKTLGSTNFVLVEFYENADFTVLVACAREMAMAGYRPIYAHIERYRCLRENVARVEILRNEGALIQVNAGEFLRKLDAADGQEGEGRAKLRFLAKKKSDVWEQELIGRAEFAWKLLDLEMVDFIASDAHREDVRTPVMERAVGAIREARGENIANNLIINSQILG